MLIKKINNELNKIKNNNIITNIKENKNELKMKLFVYIINKIMKSIYYMIIMKIQKIGMRSIKNYI